MGNEEKIVETVTRLLSASREQISKSVGLSLAYVEYLSNYLVKKGKLRNIRGRYFVPGSRGRKRDAVLVRKSSPIKKRKSVRKAKRK